MLYIQAYREIEKSCTVALLTHNEAVDYFDYIKNLKNNPIARKVKLADLEHNSDEKRAIGCSLSEDKQIYWKEKYVKAKMILHN